MTRGYVAITLEYIDPRTDKMVITARQDMTIQGTNGASVTIKAGEKVAVVRAGSLGLNKWYIIRDVTGAKKCTCAANKPCVHEKYVATGKPLVELRAEVQARAETRKARKVATTKPVEQSTVQEPAKTAKSDLGTRGNLNGTAQADIMPTWLSILPSRQLAIA